jgi:hypothetical protein
MVDMPVPHDVDLKRSQHKEVEKYCIHDLDITEELFKQLKEEIKLRIELGAVYGIDLRSKSDAQAAEAILKKELSITKISKTVPQMVVYHTPSIIRTKSQIISDLIDQFEETCFIINHKNGSPEPAEWMKDEIAIGKGTYQVGIGGLHSTHDKQFHIEATDDLLISDFDVASYYPNIMMKCDLIPRLPGTLGVQFLEVYGEIYRQRVEAKRAGNKTVADSLKITLNGTFGKLGSIYSSFYSPDVMLGVTITGQLNLLCLIDKLERIKGVSVYSANTDGVTVGYTPATRDKVLKVFAANVKYTGFEYEETPYSRIAMKDVNNYIAITTDGKAKRKGLYAVAGVQQQKNPTMEVCSNMAVDYLKTGSFDIKKYTDMRDFVAVRNVKGGGVQHTQVKMVNDWEEIEPGLWAYPDMVTKPVKRKSPPPPREVLEGGKPFGRVARWYMTTKDLLPITYQGSGNQVPKTAGSHLCMTLPESLPKDLDLNWYIQETLSMLKDMGVDAINYSK